MPTQLLSLHFHLSISGTHNLTVFISVHQCSSKAKPKEITRHTKEELGEANVAKALHCSRHELDILTLVLLHTVQLEFIQVTTAMIKYET